MSDTPSAPAPTPIAAPTIAQAKAEVIKAISKKETPAPQAAQPGPAPEGKQPVAPLADLAKLSAANRELTAKLKALEEGKDASLKEARDLYAKDKRAGLAKFLAVDDASGELEQLTALYFAAPPGTTEKVEAKNDLETKVAQLEAKQKEDDDNRKAQEEKAKQGELDARKAAARESTLKVIDGFVNEDGTPTFPYSAKNRDEAGQHTIQTAVDIASARKLDLNSMPDDEVGALLREANVLVEEELADIAATRFAINVPTSTEPANITAKTTPEKEQAKVTSVPAKTASVGTNVARPAVATNQTKPHMSVREAKETLMKQLRSARHE
jgi:hypothetical protein